MAYPKADGAAGARRAAAILGIAAIAEVANTTLSEDAAKADMKLTLRHAFLPTKLVQISAQVKSGRSYRADSSDATSLTLRIDPQTVAALSGTGTPGLIIWVPPPPGQRLYWHATDPRRPLRSPIRVSRSQFIRPSIRYDITRLFDYASWTRLFSRQTVAALPEDRVGGRAKSAYAKLKARVWQNPLVGRVLVTRMAWRHVTRRSKTKTRRTLALRIVPYLQAFLSKSPDRYICNHDSIATFGRETRETRHLVCWYREALSISGETYSLLLRIKEEISYPTNWQTQPLGILAVTQRATLASWWCKKDE